MRLANVNIPDNKQIVISLTYIYGIGSSCARTICLDADVDMTRMAKLLTIDEVSKLNALLGEKYIIENELKKQISMNIKSLIDISSYRGVRHRNKLPVRGQRTHTNAKTRKGKGRAIIANKKSIK